MKSKNSWLLFGLLTVLALVLAACGPAATEDNVASGAPLAGQGTLPSEAQEITELVLQDLAEQQGVDAEEIQVVSVEAIEWPDASLGCPKPGMVYAQVVTPGYKVTVAVGEQEYTYHTGPEGFVRCEQGDQVKARGGRRDGGIGVDGAGQLLGVVDLPLAGGHDRAGGFANQVLAGRLEVTRRAEQEAVPCNGFGGLRPSMAHGLHHAVLDLGPFRRRERSRETEDATH